MVVLPLSWLLMPRGERWRPFIIAASFVFYGGWDWRFVVPARGLDRLEPGLRARDPCPPGRPLAEVAPARSVAGNLALLGYFKYYDFFVTSTNNLFASARHRRPARGALDRPPGRDLVLHVHGDQLRRRRLSRRLRAHRPREVRRVPLVLPASGRRADRAPGRADPAARLASGSALRRHVPRLLPDRHGPVHEGRDRQLPGLEHRRRRLRGAQPALVARGARRGLRLRGPDLRRLLRVHEHRDRPRRCCSGSASRRTSTPPTPRPRSRTSGAAGT